MTELEETLVYDALDAMQENSVVLCAVVKATGSRSAEQAFKNGVYAPCIKLQVLLGEAVVARGRARHDRIRKQSEEYFKGRAEEELKAVSDHHLNAPTVD